jgi:hypothetical protein
MYSNFNCVSLSIIGVALLLSVFGLIIFRRTITRLAFSSLNSTSLLLLNSFWNIEMCKSVLVESRYDNNE